MSLVNKMLNDLQQSNHPTPVMEGLLSPSDNQPERKTTKSLALFILLLLVGIIILFFNQNIFFIGLKGSQVNTKISVDKVKQETSQIELKEKSKQQKTIIQKADFKNQRAMAITNKDSIVVDTNQEIHGNINQTSPEKMVAQKPVADESRIETDSLKNEKQRSIVTTSNKVKEISRISLAEKDLSRLIKQWQLVRPNVALKQLSSLLNRYPDLPGIWSDSLTFLKSKNLNDYENLLDRSIKNFPETNVFSLISAQHYFSSGQYLKASQQLDLIKEVNWDGKSYRLAGLIMQKLGKHQLAIEHYKKLLIIVPNQGEINMAIGISYDALNQPKKAASYFILALNDKNLNPIQKRFVRQRLIAYQG